MQKNYIAGRFPFGISPGYFYARMEVNIMTNAQLNTALYEKMFAEQETYRA